MARELTVLVMVACFCGGALAVLGGGDAARPPLPEVAAAASPAPAAAAPLAIEREPAGLLADPQSMADVHALQRAADAMDRSAIPALRETALTSRHPVSVATAIRTLSRLGAVARDPQLLTLTADPRPAVRQELTIALGASGDLAGVPLLRELALAGDAEIRPLAIQALGRLGGPAAKVALDEVGRRGGLSAVETSFLRQAVTAAARGSPAMVPLGTRIDQPAVRPPEPGADPGPTAR